MLSQPYLTPHHNKFDLSSNYARIDYTYGYFNWGRPTAYSLSQELVLLTLSQAGNNSPMLNLKNIVNTISDDFPKEHIARLKKHNIQSFWIHMLLAFTLLLSLASSKTTDFQTLFLWLGVLTVTGFIRLSHNSTEIEPEAVNSESTKSWVKKYILLTTFMSSLWGVAGIILFSQTPVVQTTLLILLVSILISTIPLLLASKAAFFAQFISILAPLTFSIGFNLSHPQYLMLGIALITLAITIIFASNYLNQVINQLQETQQALQTQADTDQITQLANRRAFDSAFKKEWRRSTREQKPISLLIIDVDDFKLYNDTYGHIAGDECLKKIARAIQKSAKRPGDIAARVGGEEFAVLLPDVNSEGAKAVAERLRTNISRLDIKHASNGNKNITVSIGVSSCLPLQQIESSNQDIVYPAMLMKSADDAMYQAKREGKDAIVIEQCGRQAPLTLPENKPSKPPEAVTV